MNSKVATIAVTALMSLTLSEMASAQELETETARLLEAGMVNAGVGLEYQTSSEGTESAAPFLVELGVTNRLEMVVEPVAYTAIRPEVGTGATGVGDLEVTLVGLAVKESTKRPAVAVAGEIKIPTAQGLLIGTGEFDYTGYFIFSKRFGNLDTHANVSYSVLGQPPGTQVNNIFGFATAAKYHAGSRWDIFAEMLGNTSSSSESETATGTGTGTSAELAGGELVATIGVGFRVLSATLVSMGVSYDNNNALLIHPGVEVNYKIF